MPKTRHFRACTLCEAMCGVVVDVEDGRVTAIRGDAEDPLSRGHICPKALALADVHQDPDRLRRPLRREGASWREVGWEEALDEVARRLRAVQRAHGGSAIAFYQGNPTVHSLGAMLFGPPFARALGTRNLYSATSVDQLPHMVAAHLMFGHQLLLPVPDLDRTRFVLVVGANPAVSNGSLMTAPGVAGRLRAIRGRGGRVVVLDPRRTETAALADTYHPVRPGTDALLLLALLHVIFGEGRASPGRCGAFTDGLEEVARVAGRFPPERVASRVGIPAERIRALALDFASAPSAVAYGRVGAATQEFGALTCWLLYVLDVVTGNLDREGGAMFTRPAVDLLARTSRGHLGRWRSRVRGLPEFGGELPVAALAEEMDTPGPSQVRALVTSAGNPVLSTPNGGRLERALGGLEFMVSIDLYLNETTRFAHFILPPTGPLERDHYDLAFHALAVRNGARFSPAVFAREEGARHDWEILEGLTRRLARGSAAVRWRARAGAALRSRIGPRGLIELGLRTGPYGARLSPPRVGLGLRDLAAAPHGLDLGPLESCLPGRLFTRNRRIALAPGPLVDDVARLESRLDAPGSAQGLALIGRRELRSCNSWLHNTERLVKGPVRCTLRMNPGDAAARGLREGGLVRVTSRVGAVVAPLEVSEEMMPGVVSLPHGWGHGRVGARLAVAARHPGVSVNDLTDDQAIDAVSGNAGFSGVQVEVEAAGPA